MRFLVEVGAAIDQGNNNGSTPLWLAAQDGHLDIVRFLVEVGAATERICHHLLRHNLVRLQQKKVETRCCVISGWANRSGQVLSRQGRTKSKILLKKDELILVGHVKVRGIQSRYFELVKSPGFHCPG